MHTCVVVFLSHVASGAGGTNISKKTDNKGLSFLGLLKLDITAVGGATDLQGRDILVKLQGHTGLQTGVVLPQTNRK